MPPRRYEIRRYLDLDGRTLFFAVYLGSRSRGWKTFKPHEAPDFEGDSATFEVRITKGQWEFGRQL